MIKVTCQVENQDQPAKESLKVHAHWNQDSYVVLEVGLETYTVKAGDLIAAIENCTHTQRHG
jgi:hypothetical protein